MIIQPTEEGNEEFVEVNSKDTLFDINQDFRRFNACNDVFARSQWDKNIRSKKAFEWFYSMLGKFENIKEKKAEGFQQKDFALRNAGWTIANLTMERGLKEGNHDGFTTDIRPFCDTFEKKVAFNSLRESAKEIKRVAKLFGADLVGLTAIDKRWHYTHRFDAVNFKEVEVELPEHLTGCIVIGTVMPYDLIETYPSALGGAAVGYGYSKEAFSVQTIAQYIRYLGYDAIASVNDSALSIPYAIQSGLAEYGRNGLAINKEFGPRVRYSKIFTNLPFEFDNPTFFGVTDFCKICNKCAVHCPASAIPMDEPSFDLHNVSNIKGVKKWTVDGEACFKSWINQGTECGICIRVCPYNMPQRTRLEKGLYKLFLKLASSRFRKVALWLDNKLAFGKRVNPRDWWKREK